MSDNGSEVRKSKLDYKKILNREFTLENDLNKYTRDNWNNR